MLGQHSLFECLLTVELHLRRVRSVVVLVTEVTLLAGASAACRMPGVWGRNVTLHIVSLCVAGYLVDPASSHMLVSKIKPCMSKYKRLVL